jgi:hypothetical protein
MNERIRELAEQAGFNPYNYQGSNLSLFEKFAELIVRECVQTLQDNTPVLDENESLEDWNKGYIRAMLDCEHHIQEHFGVE